ncbi:MAG: hypothetical protein AB7Q01_14055 [Gammaproteobacteria bacterium]
MAIKTIQREGRFHFYAGLSTDTKPVYTTVPVGSYFWEDDTDDLYRCGTTGWVKVQQDIRLLAGERQEGSATGADHLAVAEEWAVKAIAYNGTLEARTVYDGPCLVRGIEVTTAMSAHASQLEDDGTSRYPIPASRAVGIYTFPGATIFETDCVWDPGSLSAGAILVWYRPLDTRVTWAY